MKQYIDLINDILENGETVDNRTGVATKCVYGRQMRFDLSKGFPAVTTKRLVWKGVVSELLWFLEGSSDERRLAELYYGRPRDEIIGKKTIWTANADNQGVALGYRNDDLRKDLGPVYGAQWRNFNGQQKDQIKALLTNIRTNPDSRRLILSAWNPLCIPNDEDFVSDDDLYESYLKSFNKEES